jgi:hypothetical protein
MIIAIEHFNNDGILVIEHLNPDGTVDTIDTGMDRTASRSTSVPVTDDIAQICVYMNEEKGKEHYVRMGEIQNPEGGGVNAVIADLLVDPLRAYSDILRVYVDSYRSLNDDYDDEDDDD